MSTEPYIPPRPDLGQPSPSPRPAAEPPAPEAQLPARQPASWSWVEAIGVYLVAFLLAGLATVPVFAVLGERSDLALLMASVLAALVIVAVLVAWLQAYHRDWRVVMGFPERGVWPSEIRAGAVFGIGLYAVAVFLVGGILLLVLNALSGQPVQAPEQVPQGLSAAGLALTVVYAIVIAPIGEELFFRGILFRSLRDRHGFGVGAAGSAVAFGLIHYIPGPTIDAALLMLVMMFTGAALAYLYERRGTIVAPMAAHMMFNMIGLALIVGLR